jgi:hypothetical protein
MKPSDLIAQFWRLFAMRSQDLAHVKTADSPVYDELLVQLQRIDKGLFLELSPGNCELTITADGDRSLFDLVDAIVAAAPEMNGWTFFALKPKVGFAESANWEGYTINLADVVFEPLANRESDALGLRMLVPGLKQENTESAHNALLRVLDLALGERAFAESIQYTEVAALDEAPDEYIPLVQLESFIEWHRSRDSNRAQ